MPVLLRRIYCVCCRVAKRKTVRTAPSVLNSDRSCDATAAAALISCFNLCIIKPKLSHAWFQVETHTLCWGTGAYFPRVLLQEPQENKNKFRPSLKNDCATFKKRPQSKQKDLNNIFLTASNPQRPGSPGLNTAGSDAASCSSILDTGK